MALSLIVLLILMTILIGANMNKTKKKYNMFQDRIYWIGVFEGFILGFLIMALIANMPGWC